MNTRLPRPGQLYELPPGGMIGASGYTGRFWPVTGSWGQDQPIMLGSLNQSDRGSLRMDIHVTDTITGTQWPILHSTWTANHLVREVHIDRVCVAVVVRCEVKSPSGGIPLRVGVSRGIGALAGSVKRGPVRMHHIGPKRRNRRSGCANDDAAWEGGAAEVDRAGEEDVPASSHRRTAEDLDRGASGERIDVSKAVSVDHQIPGGIEQNGPGRAAGLNLHLRPGDGATREAKRCHDDDRRGHLPHRRVPVAA